MMVWLLRNEAFPGYFTNTFAGYSEILSGDMLLSDSWMKIMFNNDPIGYSHTSVEVNETDPLSHYLVNNEISMKLQLMQEDHEIDVKTLAVMDIMYQLQEFSFSLSSKPSDSAQEKQNMVSIKAMRRRKDSFLAAIVTPQSTSRVQIEIPPDVIIYSPMTEMAMKNLKPGNQITIKTLEPTTLTTALVTVRAVRYEDITINNTTFAATLLSSEYHGTTVNSWIDNEGAMLRQETPFGWTMERCSAEDALNSLLTGGSKDMLREMSVPCRGNIHEPLQCTSLMVKLTGVRFDKNELESFRQTVKSIDKDETILVVGTNLLHQTLQHDLPIDKLNELTRDSVFIQSSNPKILKQAAEIVHGLTNDTEKAIAIYDWVYRNVEKVMTVSLPSALDVLNTMKGDCNEHTYLFVALARATGLPSKIKVGLAYYKGSFYYHAWPAVLADKQWMEMDPTWGEQCVDATHIAFTEGELSDQVQIIKLLGQLRIEVLEATIDQTDPSNQTDQSDLEQGGTL